jgi:hypothetical protein
MAITHGTTVRNALANEFASQTVSGTTAPILEFQTSASSTTQAYGSTAEVATITLNSDTTPFTTSSTGQISADGLPISDTTPVGGTIGAFTIFSATESIIMCQGICTVSSTADISISSVTISTGDTVTLNTLTYTAPA